MRRIIFDEDTPRPLRKHFPRDRFVVNTVQELGWAGVGNGELLEQVASLDPEAFITLDRGIPTNPITSQLDLPVILLESLDQAPEEYASLVVNHVLPLLERGIEKRTYTFVAPNKRARVKGPNI